MTFESKLLALIMLLICGVVGATPPLPVPVAIAPARPQPQVIGYLVPTRRSVLVPVPTLFFPRVFGQRYRRIDRIEWSYVPIRKPQ